MPSVCLCSALQAVTADIDISCSVASLWIVSFILVCLAFVMPGKICQICTLTISNVQTRLDCSVCALSYHASCCRVSATDIQYLRDECVPWKCNNCVSSNKGDNTPIADKSMSAAVGGYGSSFLTVAHFEKLMSAINGLRSDSRDTAAKLSVLQSSVEKCNDGLESTKRLLQENISACQAEIGDLKAKNSALEDRIIILESAASEHSSGHSVDREDVVREVFERQMRAKNLLIFGLREHENVDGDRGQALDLLNAIDSGLDIGNFKVFRLGRKKVAGHTRPVKLTFEDETTVSRLLGKTRNLKNVELYKGVSVSADRTPAQISTYRKAKEELRRRVSNGDTGLRIRSIRGVPRVISAPSRRPLN